MDMCKPTTPCNAWAHALRHGDTPKAPPARSAAISAAS
jgi:hypothetical protein